MRAITGLCVLALTLAACTAREGSGNPFPTPPPGAETTVTSQTGGGPTSGTIVPAIGDTARVEAAIEQALLTLGLQPSVSYNAQTDRFDVTATGNTPLDNAKLAERIIRIIGDPDQPGAIVITHSQLRVRIRPDPNSDRPCNCGFQ